MLNWFTDFVKWEGSAIAGILIVLWALGVFQIQLTNRVDVLYQYYKQLTKRDKTMPNWCNNSITIQGSTDTLKPIWEETQKTGLLNAIRPMPNELEGTTSPSPKEGEPQPLVDGHDNWYSWRVENWGTKWDVDSEGLEFEDNGDGTATIMGWFDSAWAPPIEAYNHFLDSFDGCSLDASYEEGGMDFCGIYDNGDDQYMEDISEWCRAVIKGTTSLEDTPALFQKLEDEFELIENRREYIEEEMAEEAQKETA